MQLQDSSHGSNASLLSMVAHSASCVGRIVEVTPDGTVFVDSPRNVAGPVEAKYVVGLVDTTLCTPDASVLLMFDEEAFENPIILGVLATQLPVPRLPVSQIPATRPTANVPSQGENDAKRVVIEANDELVLRCGASSVTLRKDGKLIIKGKNLVSRASQTNRIKGGKVAVN